MSQVTTPMIAPPLDTPPPGASDRYEVLAGQLVEPPSMGAFEVWIANALADALRDYFADHDRLGRVVIEMIFRLDPGAQFQRRPDLAFVSFERGAETRPVPRQAAWDVVPDLAVEVVSPNDLAVEIQAKLRDYFRAGVRLVWVIYPDSECVYVYHGRYEVAAVSPSGALDGEDMLPGFRLALADLFGPSEV